MEGPSIRRMMANGVELFSQIAELIKSTMEQSNTHPTITHKEIDDHCSSFGRLSVLLDGVFSKINTKRGGVTDSLIVELEKQLELARVEWDRVGLSLTHKWHLLMDHVVELLRITGGFVDMGEDVLERFHQTRVRDESRLNRLRNEGVVKNAQAKIQHTRMIHDVQKMKDEVHGASKRKRDPEKQSLGKVREAVKKQKREELREAAITSVMQQDPSQVLIPAREILKREIKNKEEQNNETTD